MLLLLLLLESDEYAREAEQSAVLIARVACYMER